MILPEGHRAKVEFYERQFATEVAEAHGQEPEGFVYWPDTGECDFGYEVDEELVRDIFMLFEPDRHWKSPEAKRLVELLDREELTAQEEKELRQLERRHLRRQLGG